MPGGAGAVLHSCGAARHVESSESAGVQRIADLLILGGSMCSAVVICDTCCASSFQRGGGIARLQEVTKPAVRRRAREKDHS